MYLLDKLPTPLEDHTIHKYYYYTEAALQFIKHDVLPKYPNRKLANQYNKLVDECIKYSNICLNSIELPPA